MAVSRVWLFSLVLVRSLLRLEASHFPANLIHIQQPTSPNPDYRTSYHFQPPKNWMNDPNGPMIYKGIYHLFYQYNPYGADWGNIVWAHSTSKDLINWIPHPPAIYPSQPSDLKGCWSGSTTILPGGTPAILYTGIDTLNHQVQNLATPKNLSDPFLLEWVKQPRNPLMAPSVTNRINSSSFRDPTTGWLGPDGRWRVVVGSHTNRKGLAVLYTSKDFVHWTRARKPLHFSKDSGMWECPDFFPVSVDKEKGLDSSAPAGPGVKHVLKVSLDDTKHDYYTVGTYNVAEDIYVPDKDSLDSDLGYRYDYGKYYASKSFFDSDKERRILWGWVNESLPPEEYVKQGWAGVQAIPRKIWLDESGKQLVQWPIEEIEKLRIDEIQLSNKVLEGGSTLQISPITAAQADVEISFEGLELEKAQEMDPNWINAQEMCSNMGASVELGGLGPFGFLVLASKLLQEYTAVFFRVFKPAPGDYNHKNYVVLMCSDQTRSSLNNETDKTTYGAFVKVDDIHKPLSLRSLIDHSIVESFGGGGKACITARVYPTLAMGEEARLYAFNNGNGSVRISTLKAWSMKKAHIY